MAANRDFEVASLAQQSHKPAAMSASLCAMSTFILACLGIADSGSSLVRRLSRRSAIWVVAIMTTQGSHPIRVEQGLLR
jgi:hypothetical protein